MLGPFIDKLNNMRVVDTPVGKAGTLLIGLGLTGAAAGALRRFMPKIPFSPLIAGAALAFGARTAIGKKFFGDVGSEILSVAALAGGIDASFQVRARTSKFIAGLIPGGAVGGVRRRRAAAGTPGGKLSGDLGEFEDEELLGLSAGSDRGRHIIRSYAIRRGITGGQAMRELTESGILSGADEDEINGDEELDLEGDLGQAGMSDTDLAVFASSGIV